MKMIFITLILLFFNLFSLYTETQTGEYAAGYFSSKYIYLRSNYSYFFYDEFYNQIPVNFIFEDSNKQIWTAIAKSVALFKSGEWIIYRTPEKIDYISEQNDKIYFINYERKAIYTIIDNKIVKDSFSLLIKNNKNLEDLLKYSFDSSSIFYYETKKPVYNYVDSDEKEWLATEDIGLLVSELKEDQFKLVKPEKKMILKVLDNIESLNLRYVYQVFFGFGYFSRWKITLEAKQFYKNNTIIAMNIKEPLESSPLSHILSIKNDGSIIDEYTVDAFYIKSDELGIIIDHYKSIDWFLGFFYRTFLVTDNEGKFRQPTISEKKKLTEKWLNKDQQLFQAICDKELLKALRLISSNANIQGYDVKQTRSALFLAAYYDNIEIIESLIKKGVKIDKKDLLLCWPLQRQNYQLLDYLLRHGANPSLRGPTIAGYASALVDISMDKNDTKAIDLMLKYNLEFDYVSIRRLAIKMPEYYYKKINPDLLIQELSTSSYLTEPYDKNAYHPVKVFDGKEDTGWIENAKDFGNGEYIGCVFEKPIIVDKIVIMPGWFDKRYWKKNHRVKKILIDLDNQRKAYKFPDVMEPQTINFKKPQIFTKAKFEIMEVYESTKWDDTAITEIQFFCKGKKLDIDISKYAEFLKVMP
ncbi:MAG: hypothetical protein JXL97_18300 [Bacteroidales bacterium]|nr:hypothetical protein [Bacteroidales bacterium]